MSILENAPMFIRTGNEAVKYIGIPRSTQYRMIEDGELPPTIRLNNKRQGWYVKTLIDFFEGKAAEAAKAVKNG